MPFEQVALRARQLLSIITPQDALDIRNGSSDELHTTDARLLRQAQEAALETAEKLFVDSLARLRGNGYLHLAVAQYARWYRGNKHIEKLHLSAVEVCLCFVLNIDACISHICLRCICFLQSSSALFDVRLMARLRLEDIRREESTDSSGSLSIASRVKYEKLKAEVDRSFVTLRDKQVDFWTELCRSQPSSGKLMASGRAVQDVITSLDELMKKIVKLEPNSVRTLRMYADFQQSVMNNSSAAAKLFQQADDIEDAHQKEQAHLARTVTMFATVRNHDVLLLLLLCIIFRALHFLLLPHRERLWIHLGRMYAVKDSYFKT